MKTRLHLFKLAISVSLFVFLFQSVHGQKIIYVTDRPQETTPPIVDTILYNGIELSEQWPPNNKVTYKPMTVPYLDNPPEVIPIDVGRQLFVDDFLIERTNLIRSYYLPEYHQSNPVLTWSKPWEMEEGHGPYAAPFSDGVWYDPADKLFKMWYMAGLNANTCYAYSLESTG